LTSKHSGVVLDVMQASNYLSSVEVYREYNDTSEQATMYWESHRLFCPGCQGSGCAVCGLQAQSACLVPRDPDVGVVVPTPAVYEEGQWSPSRFAGRREPDRVSLFYLSGKVTLDPAGVPVLSDDLARAIANMATARLSRPLCTECENVRARELELRKDLATMEEGKPRIVPRIVMESRFGTRAGEVDAWKVVQNYKKRHDAAPTMGSTVL
jgi:hypothetical protein